MSNSVIKINGVDEDSIEAEQTFSMFVKLDGVNSGTYDAPTKTVNVFAPTPDPVTEQINGVTIGTVASGGTNNQVIENTDGTTVGTEANPSIVGDATATVNGVSMASIPAEGTENIEVRQETGATLVGSQQGQFWRVSDASVTVNSAAFDTVVAEGLIDVPVKYENGTPVGTIVAGGVEIPDPVVCASVSVAVSDTTPNIGDSITITAAPSNITPTSYFFFSICAMNNIRFIAEQASNVFVWTVDSHAGSNRVFALATDGSNDVYSETQITISIPDRLLDTYSGATVAYSLRLLRKAYSGALVLIRRSSDNAQKAFYPDTSFELSISSNDGAGTTLESWIGGDDGYVVTWYDQSGNSYDVTQATAGAQPKVISQGFLIGSNGQAAVKFDGTDDFLKYSSLAFANGLLSIFSVQKLNNPNSLNAGIFDSADNLSMASANGFRFDNVGNNFRFGTNSAFTSFANGSTSQTLNTGIKTSTNRTIYIDGVQKNTTAIAGNVDFTGVTQHKVGTLGDNSTETSFLDGFISEIVVYNSDETSSRTGIETNINANYNTY